MDVRPVPIPIEDGLRTTVWPRGLRPGGPGEAGLDVRRLEAAMALVADETLAGRISGAVVTVVRAAVVAAHRAFGWAQVVPERRAMTPETWFDLASLTKVMATLPLVLQLVEQGGLLLDDPVGQFVPEFTGEGREAVTIRHLLTHSAGLGTGLRVWEGEGTRAERIQRICRAPLQFPPGSRVLYADAPFILLGEVVSRVAGQPLDRLVTSRVMQPAGLRETGFCPPAAQESRCAATELAAGGRPWCGIVHDPTARALDGVAGHAGLFAPAAEVAAYGQLWLAGGSLGGAQVLSAAACAEALRDHTAHLGGERRGWGWLLQQTAGASCGDLFSPLSFGHTGYTGTSLWVDPERQLVVVLLTSRVHPVPDNGILRLRPRFHNAVAAAVSQAGVKPRGGQ